MRHLIYGQLFNFQSIQRITCRQTIFFFNYINTLTNIFIKKKTHQTLLFTYCLFPERGSSNQLTSARSKHRSLMWWCLWCRRGTSNHRLVQPVQRSHLQHGNLSPWAPPPLSYHWSAHISTMSPQITLLSVKSLVASVPFFCPSVGAYVLWYMNF